MTGMDVVIELRLARMKPTAVFVDLVASAGGDDFAMSSSGTVYVNIGADESLADLDFRPLVGLTVHVNDCAGDHGRHRRVAALVAAVEPALLVMPVVCDGGYVVHRRFAGSPPRTETLHL